MNFKVASDGEFVRCGCSGERRIEVIEKDREWFRVSGRKCRMRDVEYR